MRIITREEKPFVVSSSRRFQPAGCHDSSKRILVKQGELVVALQKEEILLAYTASRVSFIIDRYHNKYTSDKSLRVLFKELDPQQFFRPNRQTIINGHYIRSFRTFQRVRLQVSMQVQDKIYPVIVSQEQAVVFRKWIQGLR